MIDISPTISERLGVWPGDVAFSREESLSIACGDNIGLSSIRGSVHLGAHADAPIHYTAQGEGVESRSLAYYFGRCQVVEVKVERGGRIMPNAIQVPIQAPRVLFRTGTFPNPEQWNQDFAAFSPDLVDFLAEQGVVTIGIDTPSVDPQNDAVLLSHQRVAAHDLAILEGLVLGAVKPGLYTLIALPLKIEGADAAPVRAALFDDGGKAAP
ncbi:MAG: cyclase family protein [Planctomycetes bacterium]|nr:cyclase family protein [Planctomycetota bacterium]